MKQLHGIALAGLCAALVYGCGSKPAMEDGKAGVEDRTPTAAARQAPPVTTTSPQGQGSVTSKPVPPTVAGGANPLKDPNNILSKRSVFFEYDSDAIKEEFRPLLQAHARYLSANRAAKMLIQGNADERGSREHNIALGQRRADATKRMLVLLGAEESQVESASLGEEKPRCEDKTDACYAQNRRGDLLYGGEY